MRKSGIMVGLMSGTSADGVDACVVELSISEGGRKPLLEYGIMGCETFVYPRALQKAILNAATVDDACRLNFAVAEAFSLAATASLKKARVAKSRVLAIASHGQTICHAPNAGPIEGFRSRSTLQVGDISLIAARTGITCVGDFRTKDVALGGQGAPLVPFVDYLLTPPEGAVWLNIGGIANITVVPPNARADDVIAFDTGPGNTLLDRFIRQRTDGRRHYDRNGRLALVGRVEKRALAQMLLCPYFRRRPPKSTGPEEFGEDFLRRYALPAAIEDACATLAALSGDTIAAAIRRATGKWTPPAIVASGGGVLNRAIMGRIRAGLPGVPIVDSGAVGIPPDAKEAFAFAVLGARTLAGVPNNLPSATGASRRAVLGKIALPD